MKSPYTIWERILFVIEPVVRVTLKTLNLVLDWWGWFAVIMFVVCVVYFVEVWHHTLQARLKSYKYQITVNTSTYWVNNYYFDTNSNMISFKTNDREFKAFNAHVTIIENHK